MKANNFSSIEGLRAWMAWWVVVGHGIHLAGAPPWLPNIASKLFVQGDVAVNVFIIVSGFVITHLLLVKNESYGQYIVRRFFRLFPIYVFCLLFAIATTGAYRFAYIELPFSVQADMRLDRLQETAQNFGVHFFAHLTMLHGAIPSNVLPYAGSSILAPAWSLSLEWQFYLLAPMLIGVLSRSAVGYAAAVAFCIVLYFGAHAFVGDVYQYHSMIALALPLFVVGISSRLLLVAPPRFSVWIRFAAAIAFLFFGVFYRLEAIIWGVWFVFILNESGNFGGGLSVFLGRVGYVLAANKYISTLGRWSFSTYLFHIPFFAVILYVSMNVFGFQESQFVAQVCVFVAMILMPLVSYFMYEFIERPGIALGARISSSID